MRFMFAMQDQQAGGYKILPSRSEFDIFDRNPDPALDELTELSAVLGGADYAYMGWMDFNRLWFKSKHGFLATEQPRSSTACQWMLDTGKPLLILDAAEDPRFPPDGIQLSGAKPCRSYAGTPLITGAQQIVGALAILSQAPNQFSHEHLALLEIVGRQAATRLELYSPHQGAGTGTTGTATHGARAGHRTMLCGRHAGLNSRAGGSAGYSWQDGAPEQLVRATDRTQSGPGRRPTFRRGGAGAGSATMGRRQATRSFHRPGLRPPRNCLANCRRTYPARQLDPAAPQGTELRNPIPDCQRPGCDRSAQG